MLAIPLSLLFCGVATSQQSQALNGQIQLGDVFAGQTINVVTVSDFTVATTIAAGNVFSAGVEVGDLDVTSTQSLSGAVGASTTVNVAGSSGEQTVLTTAATGNDGEANSLGGGVLTGTYAQNVGATSVTAGLTLNAGLASTDALSASTQAVANSQGFGLIDGASEVFVNQSSAALTEAIAAVELQYTPGTATSSVIAISNNVTAAGDGDYVEQTIGVTQSMNGARTQASQYVASANAQEITGASNATANNIAISNVGGPLSLIANQTNDSYVRGEADVTAFDFGAASALAGGVGNSVLVGNFGTDVNVGNTQTNNSSVEVIASFSGNDGFDAYTTSTAVGNGITAFSCSECPGRFTANNTQRNTASISAQANTNVAGYSRSITGTSAATGNTATFYVSQPSP